MMPSRRVALIGMGKMGRVLDALAPERGWEVVARIDARENRDGAAITREGLGGADVAIDFTAPEAAERNVRAAVAAGCPIVVGTTGWGDALERTAAWVAAQGGALLTAANFSIGINVFERVIEEASRLLTRSAGFDIHLVETHHAAKKDAPSGTALSLARAAQRAGGRRVPITSVRTGSVPGIHELIFDAPFESISLSHSARDRRVFAEGALLAAAWLIGRRGVFTIRDVLAADAQRPAASGDSR